MRNPEKFLEALDKKCIKIESHHKEKNPYVSGNTYEVVCSFKQGTDVNDVRKMLTQLSVTFDVVATIYYCSSITNEYDISLEQYTIRFMHRSPLKDAIIFHNDLIQIIESNEVRLLQEEESLVAQYTKALNVQKVLFALEREAHDGTHKPNRIEETFYDWNRSLEDEAEEWKKFVPLTFGRMKKCITGICEVF